MPSTDARGLLAKVTSELPGGGEARPKQAEMAAAVEVAIRTKQHLVVQAGTGTGKSLAYLVPAVLSGKTVVVATATKALQDQLAGKDLPFLAEHLGRELSFAVLKGRSNYVCLQRIAEISGEGQMALDGLADRASPMELTALKTWAAELTDTGDRAELPEEPSPAAWAAVSVSSQECPGAKRCTKGDDCFAERARRRAADADVVVVNTHLYGLDLASEGMILPEHDIVVLDEAHQLEDTISETAGVEISAGRFLNLARAVRAIVEDPAAVDDVETSGSLIAAVLTEHVGRRFRGALDPDVADALTLARSRLDRVLAALKNVPDNDVGDVAARKLRAVNLATVLATDLMAALDVPEGWTSWVEGPDERPRLEVAPVEVGDILRSSLWDKRTAVLTSATIPLGLAERLGLHDGEATILDVGSPFDYEQHALLYCAAHLPDPRETTFEAGVHDELEALIRAAGGRTLALFTSYRAMDAAVDALRARLDTPVLSQRDLPKPALVAQFLASEPTSLFATMSFWQGIDVPGRTLSLVTIDRLPFPRPD
ncbi:MAG TPA: ATP-dependent DNA helicase, partial [Acidimicrobiales bacterium]